MKDIDSIDDSELETRRKILHEQMEEIEKEKKQRAQINKNDSSKTREISSQEYKDLNKAINLGLFSLIGIIIPFIGVILSIVSLSIVSNVKSSAVVKKKKDLAQILAIIGIILSLVSGFGWYIIYKDSQNQSETINCTTIDTFDTQAALKSGYTQSEVTTYLIEHPCTRAI